MNEHDPIMQRCAISSLSFLERLLVVKCTSVIEIRTGAKLVQRTTKN